jgi:SOS-response transcriptional repressor LexA
VAARFSRPKLTLRQAECLGFIRSYIAETGVSPALSGIAEHLGIAPPSAHDLAGC